MSYNHYHPPRASGSQSPTSEVPSNNTSPAIVTTPLSATISDETDSHSANSNPQGGTPNRLSVDLPRAATTMAGRAGCWTCRIRRKKCDEQREGDSCQTCKRLRINCLGWGPRKPDWMRDKQAIEVYKANIKAHLTREGLIRGQPRSAIMQASSSSSFQPFAPDMAGPRLPRVDHVMPPNNQVYLDQHSLMSSSQMMFAPHAQHPLPNQPYDARRFSQSSLEDLSFASTSRTSSRSGAVGYDIESPYPNPLPAHTHFPTAPTPLPSLPFDSDSTEHIHLTYYFEHVSMLLFGFSGHRVAHVLNSLVLQDPHGTLTYSMIALASLHSYLALQQSQNVESYAGLMTSQAMVLYDDARSRILTTDEQNVLTESDALAAIHLIYFANFAGSTINWLPMLTIANKWLTRTGITDAQNPFLHMTELGLGVPAILAMKMTMWFDIMASMTRSTVPEHLLFYRHLIHGGGWWSDCSGTNDPDLNIDNLTGCPADVLLCIAEITKLAHWKVQESRMRTLSVAQLIARGNVIENNLRMGEQPDMGSGYGTTSRPSISTGLPGMTLRTDMQAMVASIYREAAILYLHSVLSECHPGVPEISRSVAEIKRNLENIMPSYMDRTLIFPIFIVSCLSSDPVSLEVLRGRTLRLQEPFLNYQRTQHAIESVWIRRATNGGQSVDWRESLRHASSDLLLV